MHPKTKLLVAINVVGGVAVLGSYALGFLNHPDRIDVLWGDLPESWRSFYTSWMFVAAAGYFLYTYYVLFRLDPDRVRVGKRGYETFHVLYILILAFSALWMPLTFRMLESPGPFLWLTIRIVLAIVGFASLLLLQALTIATPPGPAPSRWLAILGAAGFAIQTALLDALIWPIYFPH